MNSINLLQLIISALVLIVLLGVSRESLKRISKIINVLAHGSYLDCPHYTSTLRPNREQEAENLKREEVIAYEGYSTDKG